jgi:hypothetical protein
MKAALVPVLLAIGLSSSSTSAFGDLIIKVDKSAQTLTVVRGGETVHRWPVSTGKSGYATPSGSFTAFRMEVEHYSKEWDDAPMPHSVFFTKQGHAIHGSYEVKRLGSPASHGCVRLAPGNAAKLFALVKSEGLANTKVVLTGSEQIALARAKAHRTATSERRSSDQAKTTTRAHEADDLGYGLVSPSRRASTPSYQQPGYRLFDDRHRPPYAVPREYGGGYVEPDRPRAVPLFDRRDPFFN